MGQAGSGFSDLALMTMVTVKERLDYGALQGVAISLCERDRTISKEVSA